MTDKTNTWLAIKNFLINLSDNQSIDIQSIVFNYTKEINNN